MPSRSPRILLIEADAGVARALERALTCVGEVMVASHASYALEWLDAGQRFDVVLCALRMRHLTGPEFHRRARRIDPAIADRIVFLAAGTHAGEERAVSALPNRILEKPVAPEKLRRIVALVAAGTPGEDPASG